MKRTWTLPLSAILLGGLGIHGCTGGKGGPAVSITGAVNVDGETPSGYKLTLYAYSDNQDAFDTSWCREESESSDCFGRVSVGQLDSKVTGTNVVWDGNNFTIENVPVDLLYILVAEGDDDTMACTTDVVGFNERTKVVTSDSAITIGIDSDLTEFELPRPVRLSCSTIATEPEAPEETVPEETGETDEEGDIPAGEDPVASWTSFTITDKTGSTVYADASAGNAVAEGLSCDDTFPSVLNIQGVSTDTAATEAYIRIQFGSGDDATFTTVATPISGGVINQPISLTGGYSVVQLDMDENLDGVTESYTITFCDRDDPPAQELLTILTWDSDDTDVDTHIWADGSEVAYYSLNQSWGSLDIDDVDGYGPETFTSAPGIEGLNYDIRVHYYSDHGNGATNASMRVIYYEPGAGQLCDFTTTASLNSYDWWNVATVGPGMVCPE
jgi:hypothetical protein